MAISVTGLTAHTQTGGGTWLDWEGGPGSSLSTATFLSSTSSRGRKFTGFKGMGYEVNAAGTDLSSSILLVRVLVNGGIGATTAADGIRVRVQDTSGNISDWTVGGSDTYVGGWFEAIIDTAQTPTLTNGTAATLTAARYVGIYLNAAASSGGDPNVYVDEVLSMPNTGLTLGGNTTNVFDEAADWDETSLYGIITRLGGVVFSKAPLILAPDATGHDSTDEVLVFQEAIYEDGTNIDSAIVNLGLSSSDTDNNALVRLTCIVEDNADITGVHAVKRLNFSSATNTDLTDCTFSGFNAATTAVQLGGSGNAINGCTFNLCGQVSAGAAPFRDCIFRNTTDASGAFFWDENTDMQDCSFFSDGTGYGIRYRPTGAGPFTDTFNNIAFSGYGADETANAAVHINPVTTTATITITVTNGSLPTKDEDAGYTGTFTLSAAVTVTVTVVNSAGSPIEGANVYLITTGATVVLNDDTNASGVATVSYTGSTPVTVDSAKSFVRSGSFKTPYEPTALSGTIDSNGYTVTAILQEDQ